MPYLYDDYSRPAYNCPCPLCQRYRREPTTLEAYQNTHERTEVRESGPIPPRNYPYMSEWGSRHYATCDICQRANPPDPDYERGPRWTSAPTRTQIAAWNAIVPRTQSSVALEHGTNLAVRRHQENDEKLCETCQTFYERCGTVGGFRRHLNADEKACGPCLEAEMADLDAFYSAGVAERRERELYEPENIVP